MMELKKQITGLLLNASDELAIHGKIILSTTYLPEQQFKTAS